MWSYYGSKTTIVKMYPKPLHSKIIEPFAGAAKYSLQYFDHDVLLVDKYEVVVSIWQWLQKCSKLDVLSIPNFKKGQRFDSHKFDCEEQKNLCSFIHGMADECPRNYPSARRTEDRPFAVSTRLLSIANNLWKIKHWKIQLGSYEDVKNENATWFIDPPYQHGGHVYKKSNKNIDFSHLSSWARDRIGQVIVCENTKADWMDFKPLVSHKGSHGKSHEAIWTNQKLSLVGKQQILL